MDAIRLTAAWVAGAMGGRVAAGDAGRDFSNVSIDSRTAGAGELFIGVRGDRFDGAEFALNAIEQGAAGVVVPRGWVDRWTPGSRTAGASGQSEPVVIEVDDTTAALQALGHAVRRASGTKVVAITGSAGKTTTKEVTSEFLEARYSVVRNRGNLNNHIGLPLSLLELRHRPEMAVVELGMNHAGEIRTLVGIAEPDVRVWTNVGEAHLGFFASVEAIADAKAEILEQAGATTLLVANADDDRVAGRIGSFEGRRLLFGIDRAADVRATSVVDRGIEGISATVTTPSGGLQLETPLVGRSNLANVLAATAVAVDSGVKLDVIAARARHLRAASHRGEVIRLPNGVTVIDDSYNANPTAMKRALEVLGGSRQAVRRVAVLGEMLELGAPSQSLHEDVGRVAATVGVDVLLTVGGDAAAALGAAAASSGMARERVRHFATSDDAADAASELVTPGDLVLVKGSRGVGTDRVVERLRTAWRDLR